MSDVRGRLEAALGAAIRSEPRLRHVQSVVASLDGEMIAELYLRGRRRDDRSNVHSVTKSVLTTLAGIAIRDQALSLETPVAELVGDAVPADDERKRLITVEHLLTMTAGLDSRTPYDVDDIADRGESLLAGPLAAPLTSDPGTQFSYNNGAAHVLGIAVAAATDSSLLSFAEQRLFAPLGIEDYRWPTDPEGNVLGWGHLELRPLPSSSPPRRTRVRWSPRWSFLPSSAEKTQHPVGREAYCPRTGVPSSSRSWSLLQSPERIGDAVESRCQHAARRDRR